MGLQRQAFKTSFTSLCLLCYFREHLFILSPLWACDRMGQTAHTYYFEGCVSFLHNYKSQWCTQWNGGCENWLLFQLSTLGCFWPASCGPRPHLPCCLVEHLLLLNNNASFLLQLWSRPVSLVGYFLLGSGGCFSRWSIDNAFVKESRALWLAGKKTGTHDQERLNHVCVCYLAHRLSQALPRLVCSQPFTQVGCQRHPYFLLCSPCTGANRHWLEWASADYSARNEEPGKLISLLMGRILSPWPLPQRWHLSLQQSN